MADVIDLSSFNRQPDEDIELTDGERRDAQLLLLVQSLEQRVSAIEAEQKAMDTNMEHISGALFAIVEAATQKLEIS